MQASHQTTTSWWLNPTHMQKYDRRIRIISPRFGLNIKQIFELPPPSNARMSPKKGTPFKTKKHLPIFQLPSSFFWGPFVTFLGIPIGSMTYRLLKGSKEVTLNRTTGDLCFRKSIFWTFASERPSAPPVEVIRSFSIWAMPKEFQDPGSRKIQRNESTTLRGLFHDVIPHTWMSQEDRINGDRVSG